MDYNLVVVPSYLYFMLDIVNDNSNTCRGGTHYEREKAASIDITTYHWTADYSSLNFICPLDEQFVIEICPFIMDYQCDCDCFLF